jgi:hypothetical protein
MKNLNHANYVYSRIRNLTNEAPQAAGNRTPSRLIRNNQEPDALRRFLNGEITELQYLERLRAGTIAGVPAR